jgi:hypothetical protein
MEDKGKLTMNIKINNKIIIRFRWFSDFFKRCHYSFSYLEPAEDEEHSDGRSSYRLCIGGFSFFYII